MSLPPFEYVSAKSFREAARLAGGRGTLVAGGTDLLPLMRDGLIAPHALVGLRAIPGGAALRASRSGATLGALALLADVAADRGVRRWFPALATACDAVGTQQIRNMATLGGNLCQRIRCWYFRQHVPCHKTGGRGCPAVDGLNEYLAVFGGGPCHAPHPGDPAVALAALEARVHVLAGTGRRRDVTIAELYRDAAKRRDAETSLRPGEVIERITVPGKSAGARQVYLKATQRAEWDFALVSVAVVWPKRRGAPPRIVLGGVAPQPWDIATAAALDAAAPLSQNGYKVELARTLLREALGA